MNNRQPRGRGRGRNNNNNNNNNRNNNRGGGVDRDNRIDSRARGNAAQMLDKFKKMAHDAQVNDDRVNAEYYLQFADHYFRVNADTMARREEQRLAREAKDDRHNKPDNRNDNRSDTRSDNRSDNQNNNGNDASAGDKDSNDSGNDRRPPRGRGRKPNAPDANQSDANESDNGGNEENSAPEKKPVRARRPRKAEDAPKANGKSEDTLDSSALPPAISISDSDEKPKPVRKRRVVKSKVEKEV